MPACPAVPGLGQVLAPERRVLQVLGGDRPDIADQVRVDRAERRLVERRVVAHERPLELDRREPVVALEHVRHLGPRHGERQRDRVALVRSKAGRVLLPHPRERLLDDARQSPEREAPGLLRDLLVVVTVEAAAVGACGEGRRVHLDCDRRPARDQDVAVAVDDVAPPRGNDRRAHLALHRRRRVLAGVQHLERPQAEEQDDQEGRGDDPERRRADGQRQRVGGRLRPRRWRFEEHGSPRSGDERCAAGAAGGAGRAASSGGSPGRSGARRGCPPPGGRRSGCA